LEAINEKEGIFLTLAVVLALSGLSFGAGLWDVPETNQQTSTPGYRIKGNLEPIPGHSFPKSWGRLVT